MLGKPVFLFCDFHGHSRKKNMFLYGCSSAQSWWQVDQEFDEDPSVFTQLEEVLGRMEPCFDRKSCRYTIEKSRESTARVVVWRGKRLKAQDPFVYDQVCVLLWLWNCIRSHLDLFRFRVREIFIKRT